MIRSIRRWLGLCVHEWDQGPNVMFVTGVVAHWEVCRKCGRSRTVPGFRRRPL